MSVKSDTPAAVTETLEEDEDLLDNPIDHTETPRCDIHPDKEAQTVCEECGRNICGVDMVKSGTIELCQECFEKDAGDGQFGVPYAYILGSVPIFVIIAIFLLM